MSFAQRLRARRVALGVPQSDIAKTTGFKQCALSHFETGRREPNITNLRRLCVALDCSADYLIGLKEK